MEGWRGGEGAEVVGGLVVVLEVSMVLNLWF